MSSTAPLRSHWDAPFEILQAMQARLQGGEQRSAAAQLDWTGLAFGLNDQNFVAPQADVSEVLEPPPLTRIPRAKSWMLGVANVRGDLLPVIDLGQVLGREHTQITEQTRVVVLNDDELPAGFLVDEVTGFRAFGIDDQRHEVLQEPNIDSAMLPFLLGAFVRDGTVWKVLSLKKLVSDPVLRDAGA